MKKYYIVTICFFIWITSFVFLQNQEKCFSFVETQVSWNSMSGILKDGEYIEVWEWYYNCYEVARWDIIIYQTVSRGQLVKEIKVLPWDRLQADFVRGYLGVNGEILSNYAWEKYIFTQWELAFMQLYFQNGKMKEDTYFIFWTTVSGGYDSRKFAWITKGDLIWKVFLKN